MTRPDDEFPPLDVTSTLNLGSLDEVLEGPDADVVPSRMSGSLPPGMALLVVRRGPNAGARFLLVHDVATSEKRAPCLSPRVASHRQKVDNRPVGQFLMRVEGVAGLRRGH